MISIDGNNLTIKEVVQAATTQTTVKLSPKAIPNIDQAHKWICEISQGNKAVYGINTGFGIFSETTISHQKIAQLNRNLILSHSVGTGPEFSPQITRAAILIRGNTLAHGHSGIRTDLIENLLALLNKNVTPWIPSQGSLGSSGDLAPLSHLALVLTTDDNDKDEESGFAYFNGERMTGKSAMKSAQIERLQLKAKEGLALINGATFSAAIAVLASDLADTLIHTAEVSAAASLEALLGASAAFDPRLHQIRNQIGQIESARRIRALTKGSSLINAAGRVQDTYSLRCAPQVQGPVRDTLNFVQQVITREINAATDNPLVFGPGEAISGGNFHGEIVGMAMDYLKIAISELGAISERRIFQLTDVKMNAGLPDMLVDNPDAAGLNSGMMMPHYTAVSLALENQHLATPDTINSLPTSGGKEDHNANSLTAARHAYQIAENSAHILAIELYAAIRALDIRMRDKPGYKMGAGVTAAYERIRDKVPYQPGDAWWAPEIEEVKRLVLAGELALKQY